jgi:hypothetical protein
MGVLLIFHYPYSLDPADSSDICENLTTYYLTRIEKELFSVTLLMFH